MTKKKVSGRAIGGKARAKSLSPAKRSAIAKKAAEQRWEKPVLSAVHGSDDQPLRIGDIAISCYVLSDGTRVLSQRGLQSGIGLSEGGRKSGERRIVALFTRLEEKGINTRDLIARANSPIRFIPPHGGNPADGYDATVLPDICAVLIEAAQKGALDKRLRKLAERAATLQHGFATVGIIALVDEATGYQRDRARDALAKILEAFVVKEMQPWVKTFPSEFYEQMFRLRGIPFPVNSVKRPSYFGHLTNDVIYRRLAPGVWEELKREAEQAEILGLPKGRLHQRLTPSIGHPKLRELLVSVTTIMKLSAHWADFKEKLDRIHPAFNETMALPFDSQPDDGTGI
jgi:hypothetical protein